MPEDIVSKPQGIISKSSVVVAPNFTNAAQQPPIPPKMNMHPDAVSLFKAAPEGVAFTGCVFIHTNGKIGTVYMAPLQADQARKNIEIEKTSNVIHGQEAGDIAAGQKPQHLFHPNLSAAGRAMTSQTSGHFKLCAKYGLDKNHCVGFAITKKLYENKLTTTSQTLNSEKFRVAGPVQQSNSPALQALMMQNAGSATVIGPGYLSREWAYRIANTIEIACIHSLRTKDGYFEAPF